MVLEPLLWCHVIQGTYPNLRGQSYQHITHKFVWFINRQCVSREVIHRGLLITLLWGQIVRGNIWQCGNNVVSLLWCSALSSPLYFRAGWSSIGETNFHPTLHVGVYSPSPGSGDRPLTITLVLHTVKLRNSFLTHKGLGIFLLGILFVSLY